MISRNARIVFGAAFSSLVAVAACGSEDSEFAGPGSTPDETSSGGSSGTFQPGGEQGDPEPECEGLECQQVACGGDASTTLTGKVYDPSGTVPLYNAIVYVPNAPVEPFVDGVKCDTCAAGVSGRPITTTLSNARGEFRLENVPVGVDVPLVVQLGRWRRQVTIPKSNVEKCESRPVEADLTRLPRSKAEGDIPKIAVTTGNADALECFLRKLGLDDDEFTNPSDGGRVHIYQGRRGSNNHGSRIDADTPTGQALWDHMEELRKYDMVVLSCEGNTNSTTKSADAKDNIRRYLDEGGRVFASHFHYDFFRDGGNELQTVADWGSSGVSGNRDVRVDTSFAKGAAFSEWLDAVDATTAPGSHLVPMTVLRDSVKKIPGSGATSPDVSRRWLYVEQSNADDVPKFFSFNTPLSSPADQQCGRGVFTDVHVSSGDSSGGTFPNNCKTQGYTEQEKALLFLLMDLSSCVQDETKPPKPPPSGPA